MKVLLGPRDSGKTTELIRLSIQHNVPILCARHHRKEQILKIMKKFAGENGVGFPEPILANRFKVDNWPNFPKQVYIDDIELFINHLLHVDVAAYTTSVKPEWVLTGKDKQIIVMESETQKDLEERFKND